MLAGAVVGLLGSAGGCEETPGYYPNQDLTLRRPVKEIRADAAQRIYPVDAAKVKNLPVRARIGYMAKTVDVVNLTDTDWTDVEVWVNGQWVCHLPRMEAGVLKSIPWNAFYDREGKSLPRESQSFVVSQVEVYMGGKLYAVPITIAY